MEGDASAEPKTLAIRQSHSAQEVRPPVDETFL